MNLVHRTELKNNKPYLFCAPSIDTATLGLKLIYFHLYHLQARRLQSKLLHAVL